VFWLWFFTRLDVYKPEPRRLLALTFGLGMVATIPAGIINTLFIDEAVLEPGAALASVAMAMLLVVGPVEETCKFLAVRLGPYRSRYFDEPIDAMVYGAAASLGFASLENLFYVLQFGPEVMLFRAPLSTLGHLVFGSVWAYGLSVHWASGRKRRGFFALTLAGGAILHGLFNVAVFVFFPAAILLVAVGAVWAFRRFEWWQRKSPFRYRRNYPLIGCTSCGRQTRITGEYCRFCGAVLPKQPSTLICGNCQHSNRPDALYCTRCGDRLLR
jgi:protease PrsW